MQFSIIIPTLNEAKYIENLLQDLKQQDSSDFEIIHVDGKSEDDTCEIVKSFSSKLTITTIYSDRRNLSYQRNIGAEHAKGKYLIFIDADTRLSQLSFLSKLSTESKQSRNLIYFAKVRVAEKDPALRLAFSLYNDAIGVSQLFSSPLPTQGLAIFERNFFYHLSGYKVSERHEKKVLFAEDQELLKRARGVGVTGRALPNIYYIMSLRRYKREGWLGVFPKLLLSTIEQSVGRSFIESEYEMGGHLYNT
ncbi:glycosyltransferase [Candidatus Woesebacteria bacterium]|nr:glycosyltransferase [Candidatus Woesebacteria bacterium]